VERVVLELACGRGEYSQTLSGLDQMTGWVGVDIRAERMWHGIRFADMHDRPNMLFLRIIIHHLDRYFGP
jgi:tRNA (guanine-N7-)-methyltransferase